MLVEPEGGAMVIVLCIINPDLKCLIGREIITWILRLSSVIIARLHLT